MNKGFSARTEYILIFSIILTAFLSGLYAYLDNMGKFEPWNPLGKPPKKAVKIFFHKDNSPFVETADGTIYLCSHSLLHNGEDCWIETDYSKIETKASNPCYQVKPFNVSKPPGKVIDMVEFESCEPTGFSANFKQHNFALLEDGSVWTWEYSRRTLGIFRVFSYAVVGIFLGGIPGTVIAAICFYINLNKGRSSA